MLSLVSNLLDSHLRKSDRLVPPRRENFEQNIPLADLLTGLRSSGRKLTTLFHK